MATWLDRSPRPDDIKNAGGTATSGLQAPLTEEELAMVAEMRSYKRRIHSTLLDRMAHADIFEVGAAPFLFVVFGGSGVDEAEYERRGSTVIPVFDPALETLAGRGVGVVLAHVTAPYDVPLNRFSTDPSSAATWNAHVLTELLEPWSKLPLFVTGFSGGAALALNGLERDARCFGGAAFGADAVPPGFVCPDHWVEKLRLYAAPDDRVCNHPANRRIVEALESRGQAESFGLRSGGHRLADYSTPDCLGELVRLAAGIVPRT